MRSLLRRLYRPAVARRTMPARRSRVFDVVADPDTYPSWLVGAERMRRVDDAFPAPGSRFEHSVGAGPITVDDHSQSVDVVDDRRLALRVDVGPFHARVDLDLEQRPDGRTDVRFSERPIGVLGILTPLLRPALRARNEVSLSRLCELVATGGAA